MLEMLCFGRKSFHQEKWALRDINFELFPGQALGIIGFNGAGKSTLLKILTGTSTASRGRFVMDGRTSSMLELGAGFHPEFSGRANIYMNASIQGVPKAEVDRQYDEIAAFSELGEYLERPVRTYSSGMAMRLGFSAAMLVDPDILILDEVLAVGDQHFQKKCMDRFNAFRAADKTILFVSHSIYHIREICDRAIWLHEGKCAMDDTPITVTDEYEKRMLQIEAAARGLTCDPASDGDRLPAGMPRLLDAELMCGNDPAPAREFQTFDEVRLRLSFELTDDPAPVSPGILVHRNDGLMVVASRPEGVVGGKPGVYEVSLRMPSLRLLSGEYTISLYLNNANGTHTLDQRPHAFRFNVQCPGNRKGIYVHDCEWDLGENTK